MLTQTRTHSLRILQALGGHVDTFMINGVKGARFLLQCNSRGTISALTMGVYITSVQAKQLKRLSVGPHVDSFLLWSEPT
jgi:hypothetical protein